MKIIKRKKIFLLILAGVLGYLLIIKNLIVDEEPRISDIIIVPEGGDEERPHKAAELYKEGYSRSDKIIVSPLTDYKMTLYLKYGVLEKDIIDEPTATSTYTNAVETLEMMHEYGFTSAIVVSSDYHMLRTKYIYEQVNRDYNYDLNFVAAFYEKDGKEVPWYSYNRSTIRAANREVYKLIGYLLGLYHFIDLE